MTLYNFFIIVLLKKQHEKLNEHEKRRVPRAKRYPTRSKTDSPHTTRGKQTASVEQSNTFKNVEKARSQNERENTPVKFKKKITALYSKI